MKKLRNLSIPIVLSLFLVLCLPLAEEGIDLARRTADDRFNPAVKNETVVNNVPELAQNVLETALAYHKLHQPIIRNRRYLTIIDYTKPSCTKRMFVIDLKTGIVERQLVAHGKNSGRVYATTFSNQMESFKSCRGFFLTGDKYTGKRGTALALHGLEKGVNDNAFTRGIVIHGAPYVNLRSVLMNKGRLGRSLGCPAISDKEINRIVDKIRGGSLLYVYARQDRVAAAISCPSGK